MNNSSTEEIIDLTHLDYWIPPNNPRDIDDDVIEVIDLVEDSSNDGTIHQVSDTSSNRTESSKEQNNSETPTEEEEDGNDNRSFNIGRCFVCWAKLGKNPLASTRCGHVFCIECLKLALTYTKKCPSCRCVLKGSTAYHPIHLGTT